MNLYQKLVEIQKKVRGLGKDANASTYQYVSGSKVLEYIRPKMDELGVLLVQEIDEIDNQRIDYNVKSGVKSEMLSKVTMTFTWIDAESGERLPVRFGANGMNNWDKGLGSALTYAERYFLLKFFHIATDEDDIDAIVKDEAVKETKQTRRTSKASAPAASAPASDPDRPQYKPLPIEKYWGVVKAYAEGKQTKSGGDYRTEWARLTNAGTQEILKFDMDVEHFKAGQTK